MANAKLITYDLNRPEQDYPDLIAEIKRFGSWAYVQKSVWIVSSANSCESIRDLLRSKADSNDMIFVASLSGEAAWTTAICTNEQLKAVLTP
jgi:CRISPR/Cas system-associated endoribonuclease Cas2